MIKHIVIWQLKDTANKLEDAKKIKHMLESLQDKIEGLLKIEVGLSILSNQASLGDVCLYSEFATQQALAAYHIHPLHVAAKDFIQERVDSRAVVDFMEDYAR